MVLARAWCAPDMPDPTIDNQPLASLTIGHLTLAGRVLAAPMAGVSDQPYRTLARRYGAALAVSEMVTSAPDLRQSEKSRRRTTHDGEPGPISVQLLGADPRQMASAARENVARGAQIIDINMGCPTKKVCKRLVGSALMRDEPLVARILEAVVQSVDVPVTLKMRTGWDRVSRNAPVIACIAEQAGIRALTVHGRSRQCKYHGPIDYDTITEVKAAVSIPVIANGDIDTPEHARRVLQATGADAVMVGRAAQGQPWLLGRISSFLDRNQDPGDPPLAEKYDTLRGHLDALYSFYGCDYGVRIARKHFQWYAARLSPHNPFGRLFNRASSPSAQQALVTAFFDNLTSRDPCREI